MEHTPFCSVIVPTHGRPDQLGDCVEALRGLDYPRDRLEVIVVADGPDKRVAAAVERFTGELDVELVSQPSAGPAAARNAGAALARGEILAFTDDDCAPAPDWLRRLVARCSVDCAAGGRTVNGVAGNPYASTAQLIIDTGYASSRTAFFTTNNLVLPADGFRAVGGFDPEFRTSEDRDLCERWVSHGMRMAYVPEAVVLHFRDLGFWSFCRQHFSYGRGAFRFHRAYARRHGRRIRIEPSYYLALLAQPLRRGGAGLAALLILWHLANMAGFAWEWLASRLQFPR
jgi:cellulose synthase/poly-beta-1,6-N-acetylglucosamine synthase-like glycosyltransferase